MQRRLLSFFAAILAVASAVFLSRANSLASAPSAESDNAAQRSATASITTITTDTVVIPTYPYAAYLYTATNTTYNIPYRWLHWGQYDGSNPHPEEHILLLEEILGRWKQELDDDYTDTKIMSIA